MDSAQISQCSPVYLHMKKEAKFQLKRWGSFKSHNNPTSTWDWKSFCVLRNLLFYHHKRRFQIWSWMLLIPQLKTLAAFKMLIPLTSLTDVPRSCEQLKGWRSELKGEARSLPCDSTAGAHFQRHSPVHPGPKHNLQMLIYGRGTRRKNGHKKLTMCLNNGFLELNRTETFPETNADR